MNSPIQPLFVYFFQIYHTISVFIQHSVRCVLDTPPIYQIANFTHHWSKKLYQLYYKIRIEPDDRELNPWLNISYITTTDRFIPDFPWVGDSWFFEESAPVLYYKEDYIDINKQKYDFMNEYKRYEHFLRKKSCYDTLLTMKFNQYYIFKMVIPSTNDLDPFLIHNTDFARSNVRFLMVEYFQHPEDTQSITIQLPRDYLLVGNEILSNIFVMRYLEYTVGTGMYHDNYLLKIIDNNVYQFTLNSNQYLRLEKDAYQVVNMQD
jgi:hypothetical protein